VSLRGTVLFHLNLQYSSIEVADRRSVIERCYRPLLGLLDEVPGLVLAVEASGATLEAIAELAPDWLDLLCARIAEGRVELVGSGDTQLIGPLVPESVNRWNQRLGVEAYEALCGVRPTTALVGEMAWSRGIVSAYLDAGYETLVTEWNNPRRVHAEWENEWRYGCSWTRVADGRRARIAWVDAVAFQKVQRGVHGDLELAEVRDWFLAQRGESPRHVFLYASDAEVLDYRPGRYATEAALTQGAGEWARAAELLRMLAQADVAFTTPRELASDPAFAPRGEVEPGSARDPIPVKKQPKYNVTRWALSGHDDVGLNARCFGEAARLEAEGGDDPEPWRRLCRLWSSDLRTHLTEKRRRELVPVVAALRAPVRAAPSSIEVSAMSATAAGTEGATVRRAGRELCIDHGDVRLALNLRRGLAVERLAFASVADAPLVGTIPHGALDDIRLAADFYTGHTVLDVPGRARITDLAAVEPEIARDGDAVCVLAQVPTPLGAFEKRVIVEPDAVRIELGLSRLGARPLCSLRAAHVTLLSSAFGPELFVTAAQGGAPERFAVDGPCDHTRGVPPLCTASAAFGATDGRLAIDDGEVELLLSWDPARAAALPMLLALPVHHDDGANVRSPERLVRVAFSLSEVDDTFRAEAGAPLLDFALTLRARRIRR